MNNISNGIGYQGKVTVRLTKSDNNPIELHNVGYKALWDALAMAVTGYDVSSKVPSYFMVCSKKGSLTENDEPADCLLSRIPFVGSVWGNAVEISGDSTAARFTAVVTKRDRRITINGNDIAVLRMYNDEGELLAEVEDNFEKDIARSHNSMITGVDAIYEWKMIFKNVAAASEGKE